MKNSGGINNLFMTNLIDNADFSYSVLHNSIFKNSKILNIKLKNNDFSFSVFAQNTENLKRELISGENIIFNENILNNYPAIAE